MSLQKHFNYNAIAQLPKIAKLIESAETFEANQMSCKALHEINDCHPCLYDMSENQKETLQEHLISLFKRKGWSQ